MAHLPGFHDLRSIVMCRDMLSGADHRAQEAAAWSCGRSYTETDTITAARETATAAMVNYSIERGRTPRTCSYAYRGEWQRVESFQLKSFVFTPA